MTNYHEYFFLNLSLVRNEKQPLFVLHVVTNNRSDHGERVRKLMRKWHEIIHVWKWINFGGHLNFVTRETK